MHAVFGKRRCGCNVQKLIRLLVGAALTVAVAYVLATPLDKVRANVSQRDSIQYWAAGKLLVHRDNPYDVKSTVELEWEQGYAQKPPCDGADSSLVAVPFSSLGTGQRFLGVAAVDGGVGASLILAMRLSRNMFQRSDDLRSVFLLVGYLFASRCLRAWKPRKLGFVGTDRDCFVLVFRERAAVCGGGRG